MRYHQSDGRARSRRDLIAVVTLTFIGVIVTTLSPAQQARIAVALRSSVLYPVLEIHRTFAERARLRGRLDQMRAERDDLTRQLAETHTLAEAGRQLRVMAGIGALESEQFGTASLVPGRPQIGDAHVFVLRGSDLARARPPVGVFTGRGLVGVVRSIDSGVALGDFWSHPDFRVSVETVPGDITGIVRAEENEVGQHLMILEGAPFQEEIEPGTLLVTTGLSGVYPRGIPVGTVRAQQGAESGWMKRYAVEPAVRPAEADAVLVWMRPDAAALR